jgi:predicted HNH restriction endonuclease
MNSNRKDAECYFCGETNLSCLELHHILPTSIWVQVDIVNCDDVWLCANCHVKLHKLLSPFFKYIKKITGVKKEANKNE